MPPDLPPPAPPPVLLVENQEDLAQILCDFLSHRGHAVRPARGVREALDALDRGERPGIALVDWTLSDGDASPILDRLTRDHPGCAVVLTTGHGSDIAERARGRVAAILYKPFTLRELARVLAQLTRGF